MTDRHDTRAETPLPPPPAFDTSPCVPGELRYLVGSGENDDDACERLLAQSARVEGSIDLALGEGLLALESGDRLVTLAFGDALDYAREVLDLKERQAQVLVQLARELRSRPLLRAAVLSGRVKPRLALTVLPVARGDDEAAWVERAATETVRALQDAVREARGIEDEEEEWTRFRVGLAPEDRAAVDEGLEVAGRLAPGSSRILRLESMAQEYLGGHPVEAEDVGDFQTGGAFRPVREAARRAETRLEAETERWPYLPRTLDVAAPALGLDDFTSAEEIDRCLRSLARLREEWDGVLGHCALVVRRSGLWRLLGFHTWEHYCKERLSLAPRTVEQRASLEKRLWEVPALRAARDAGIGYEKVRALSDLPPAEVKEWAVKAPDLTVVELREAVGDRVEAQMCAWRRLSLRMPVRVARLLQGAFRAVREVEGQALEDGRCLAIVARHFTEVWKPHAKPPRTVSQKVRERDRHRCQVPGCSRRAVHAHHRQARAQGGSDDPSNQIALCAFHHLRALHGGYLKVAGTAPDALVWTVKGRPFDAGFFRWRPPGTGDRAGPAQPGAVFAD